MKFERFEVVYDLLKKGYRIVLKGQSSFLVDGNGDYSTEISKDELMYLVRNQYVILDLPYLKKKGGSING